jgi:hypothetical protein
MKRFLIAACAVLFLVVFSAGDLISAETAQPAKQRAVVKESAKAEPPKMIETFLGTVTGVDLEKKTLTVRTRYETEYHITKDDTATRELVADEADVTFDIAKARLVGFRGIGDIHAGSHVRVGYDRKGEVLIAHTVLRIPPKRDRSIIRTFLGTVSAVDEAKKTLTVKAILEGEFYVYEENMSLKEYILEEKDIAFDTSKALFVGNKKIDKGDTVRVGFDEKGGACIAHTVLKIEKR